MIWIVVFALGALIGFVIGRWWALVAALALAVYVALESQVDEVSPGLLASIYGVIAAAGISAGIVIRHRFTPPQGS